MKIVSAILLSACTLYADLSTVQRVVNPEKRSGAALENAELSLKSAKDAYAAGDVEKAGALLEELAQSVELAEKSLNESGKNPLRSPKHFKHAEIKTSQLLRKLDAFAHEMSYVDRPLAEKVKQRVQEVHDRLLAGIMSKKK